LKQLDAVEAAVLALTLGMGLLEFHSDEHRRGPQELQGALLHEGAMAEVLIQDRDAEEEGLALQVEFVRKLQAERIRQRSEVSHKKHDSSTSQEQFSSSLPSERAKGHGFAEGGFFFFHAPRQAS